ncbi:MAG: MFS transporter, partial [Chloroflexota bacterium]
VGLGCISSVGFSVVSDFIPAHRRGIALSFWGISQAGGAGAGAMLGGTIGATQWQLPFFIVAGAGLVFAILYLFTFEPKRGQTEPELADIFAEGGDYNYPIQWADIRQIVTRKSNAWLIFQGFITTLPGGALFWLSRLYIARVETMGYTLETATIAGNMLSLFFQSGFYFAILAGYLGDRWQQRDLAGRARLSLIGLLSAMPALMIVYLIPLPKLDLPVQGSELEIAVAAVLSIVTNPRMTLVFLIAVVAWALTSIHTPNRTALLTDVNLPEHRGTVIGLIAVGIGVGAAVGNALAGSLFGYLESYVDAPLNYALGLTLFQLFFIPAAWCSYKTMKTAPTDIRQVQQILRQRGAKKAEEVSEL